MSKNEGSTILTCAVTGAGAITPRSGAVPITPREIADECIAAARAGAAVVHIHVRDPQSGAPSMELRHYREAVERIRDSGADIIINLTSGVGARFIPDPLDPLKPAPGSTLTTPERRVEHILELRPEICSLDMGTMNFGRHAVINTPDHVARMASLVQEVGVRPELEIFGIGDLDVAKGMIESGVIVSDALFQLCLGVAGGAPSTPKVLMMLRDLLPEAVQWGAFGISAGSFPMVAQSVLLGGHVRVGLEDTLYVTRGRLASGNAELVRRAAEIVAMLDRSLATPAQAREILNLRPH